MKKATLFLLIPLMLSSCSGNDEPDFPTVFTQISEISDGMDKSKEMTYDAYGRVIRYVESYKDETVTCSYSYPSEDLIKIHTEDIRQGLFGNNIIR